MTTPYDKALSIEALRRALPYIRLYRDKVFVLKAGGALVDDASAVREVALQVGLLQEVGIRVVLVHGGGPQTTDLATRLGLETQQIGGRRVTSPETLQVAVMTLNGSINTAILSACRAAGVPAAGVSGMDGGLVNAVVRPPVKRDVDGRTETVDFGEVGDVVSVDPTLLLRLLEGGFVPIVSPLCADASGRVLNINADTVAAEIARAMKADKLLFLTDTPGLLEDKANPRSLVSYTDVRGLGELESRGCIDAGMAPKVKAAVHALEGGVGRVHLVTWKTPGSLLTEIFTNEGSGTLIVRDTSDLKPEEQVSGT
jgi:acetylglutamate kinase